LLRPFFGQERSYEGIVVIGQVLRGIAAAFAIALLILAGWLRGADEGSSHYDTSDALHCTSPAGATVAQRITVDGLAHPVGLETTTVVTVPFATWETNALVSPDPGVEDRAAAIRCLFGTAWVSSVKVSDAHGVISVQSESDYLPGTVWQVSTVNRTHLVLSLVDYLTGTDPTNGPLILVPSTKVAVSVVARQSDVGFTRAPDSQSGGTYIWRWTVPHNLGPDDDRQAVVSQARDLQAGPRAVSGPASVGGLRVGISIGLTQAISSWLMLMPSSPTTTVAGIRLTFFPGTLAGWASVLGIALTALPALRWGRKNGGPPWARFLWVLAPVVLLTIGLSPEPHSDVNRSLLQASTLLGSSLCAGLALFSSRGGRAASHGRSRPWGLWVWLAASMAAIGAGGWLISVKISDADAVTLAIAAWLALSATMWFALVAVRFVSDLPFLFDRPLALRLRGPHATLVSAWWLTAWRSGSVVITASVWSAALFSLGSLAGRFATVAPGTAGGRVPDFAVESLLSEAAYAPLPFVAPVLAVAIAASMTRVVQEGSLHRPAIAAAAFAWAITAGPQDLGLIGPGFAAGTWLVAIAVLALTRSGSGELTTRSPLQAGSDPPESAPKASTGLSQKVSRRQDVRVAVGLSAILGTVPALYFVGGTLVDLPARTTFGQGGFFVVAALLTEVLRWLLTGWLYGLLHHELPGRVGPVKALGLTLAWFAAAAMVEVLDTWSGIEQGRVWLFPGLQLGVFLFALSVLFDVVSLRATNPQLSWAQAWKELQIAYKVQRARSLVAYMVPVALAVLAIGEQVVSGTGLQFVNSLLTGIPALSGGGR
jgi:hypothetical protein